ncbi:MAG: asparaginase [Rhodospirillaceae bacterium]|jgi:L-asparaginase|nr:asparaginase [Rhodospirillaceae bacterium]MBT6137921.1 asparaginase [Rhodospirillaceae bacterium]
MSKPRIRVIALGGTIAMVQGDTGVKPGLGAEDLIAAAPAVAELAELSAETFERVGSFDLSFDGMLGLAAHIRDLAAHSEVDGVIVTQGTDTIEETSFLLDCLLTLDIPLIVIGAMRNPRMTAPDGPGNLLAATRLAADPWVRENARNLGVMVAMLDHIHAAANVAKMDSNRIDAFESPLTGPLGTMIEDRVRIFATPRRDWKQSVTAALGGASIETLRAENKSVALATISLDETGGILRAIGEAPDALGYSGVILGTMGGGHLPARLGDLVSTLTARMPVVSAGRIQNGYLLRKTYEVAGAEMDLETKGVISAGRLPPVKARVLLTVLIRSGSSAEAIRNAFEAWN